MGCCVSSPDGVNVDSSFIQAIQENNINDLNAFLKTCDPGVLVENGQEYLMHTCGATSRSGFPPLMIQLVCEKIEKVGGPKLLEKHLASTDSGGTNSLMTLCMHSGISAAALTFLFDKSIQVGGPSLLRKELTANTQGNYNCLMFCCSAGASFESVKCLCLKLVELCGAAGLKAQLLQESTWSGRTWSCLHFLGQRLRNSKDYPVETPSFPKMANLIASLLFHFDVFRLRFSELVRVSQERLVKVGLHEGWSPDAASVAEVEEILSQKKAQAAGVAERTTTAAATTEGDTTTVKSNSDTKTVQVAEKQTKEPIVSKKKPLSSQDQPHHDSTTVVSASAPPPARCFKRGVPDKTLEDAIRAILSIKEAPSNRPDLQNWIPDKDDASDLIHYLKCSLAELKKRPTIQKLITENGLTDDEIKILHSYKIQNPYPVYLWLNGWLGGDRRDDFVKEHVAPFFTLLYRAMEKLPKIKTAAHRAIKVNNIPSLQHTFNNHKTVCSLDETLSFWGFSSFSTADDVVNREEFVGKPSEPAIVYSCGALEGVDMEPFAPQGLKDESEILPLCPCVLKVQTSIKMGQKLVVSVVQLDHADFSYVAPK